MAKSTPPPTGQAPGEDAARRRRAASRRIVQATREREHDRRQHEARANRAGGMVDPWGEGFAGDAMPAWQSDQSDTRLDHYALHSSHEQAEDGAPQLTERFLTHLSAVYNSSRRQAEADAQVADARAGDVWLSVRQVAALLGVSATTVHRAISAGHLASYRPGGPYGHHRIAVESFTAYLGVCAYDAAATTAITRRWQRWLDVEGAAPAN